jgi:hypothetical protein
MRVVPSKPPKAREVEAWLDNLQPYSSGWSFFADDNLVNDLEQINAIWNPPPSPYVADPVGWTHTVLQAETWSKQREILNAVRDNRYVAVKSCHGPGKSFTGSVVVGWWMDTQPDPFVVTSAPTSHQVRTILWREIRRRQKEAGIGGRISQGQVPEWKDDTGEVIAFGRKPADYLDATEAASAFQGIHADSLLVVLDEGSGIPRWLADACENLITGKNGRLLIIGNPDNPVSYFSDAFKPNSDFKQITISAFDTPAFTGEPVSERLLDRLTSKQWVEERKKRWGTHSPVYKSKVLGEFSEITDNTVFTPAMISDAVTNDRTRYAGVVGRNGFDVARLGVDECIVYNNRNGYVRLVARWGKADTMESVGRYRRLVGDNRRACPPTHVDATGLGAGVFDRLRELDYPVVPFNGGEKAYNPLKYKNRRAEAYWTAREMFEAGLIDIEEDDLDLQAELLEITFKVDSGGRIQIEAKDEISDRIGHSPDRADAFVMALQKEAVFSEQDQEQTPVSKEEVLSTIEERAADVNSSNRPVSSDADAIVGDLWEVDF